MYHSHSNEITDTYAGLFGGIVIGNRGALHQGNLTAKDVDRWARESVCLFVESVCLFVYVFTCTCWWGVGGGVGGFSAHSMVKLPAGFGGLLVGRPSSSCITTGRVPVGLCVLSPIVHIHPCSKLHAHPWAGFCTTSLPAATATTGFH